MTEFLSPEYWSLRYREGKTGWDIGFASPAIMEYALRFPLDTRILIPGCGKAREAQALHEAGYTQVIILDFAQEAFEDFAGRVNNFPKENLIQGDFFAHQGAYDLILEQTFFCAINRDLRKNYVLKMHSLLKEGGILAGLLFKNEFEKEGPPFGGSSTEYLELFSSHFEVQRLEDCKNSIPPRHNNELWMEMCKIEG